MVSWLFWEGQMFPPLTFPISSSFQFSKLELGFRSDFIVSSVLIFFSINLHCCWHPHCIHDWINYSINVMSLHVLVFWSFIFEMIKHSSPNVLKIIYDKTAVPNFIFAIWGSWDYFSYRSKQPNDDSDFFLQHNTKINYRLAISTSDWTSLRFSLTLLMSYYKIEQGCSTSIITWRIKAVWHLKTESVRRLN